MQCGIGVGDCVCTSIVLDLLFLLVHYSYSVSSVLWRCRLTVDLVGTQMGTR